MRCPNCNSNLEVISSTKGEQSVTDYFQCDLCGRNWRCTIFIVPGLTGTISHSEMQEIDANEIEL